MLENAHFEPYGQSRSVFEIEYELAKRMGMGQDYPSRNAEEWVGNALKPAGVILQDLRNNHIIYASPPLAYKKYEQEEGFKTPSGKVECYSERFAAAGYGHLPSFEHPKESDAANPELSKEYGLVGTTKRLAEFVHTRLRNLPVMTKRYPDPLLLVHPADATKRNIGEDDMVEVRSPRGSIEVKARLTEEIGPGMISVDYGWGNPTDKKASMNLLTDDAVWDPVSGGHPNRLFKCEIKKVQ